MEGRLPTAYYYTLAALRKLEEKTGTSLYSYSFEPKLCSFVLNNGSRVSSTFHTPCQCCLLGLQAWGCDFISYAQLLLRVTGRLHSTLQVQLISILGGYILVDSEAGSFTQERSIGNLYPISPGFVPICQILFSDFRPLEKFLVNVDLGVYAVRNDNLHLLSYAKSTASTCQYFTLHCFAVLVPYTSNGQLHPSHHFMASN